MSAHKTAVILCFEAAQSDVGRFAASAARLLSARGQPVALFTREALGVNAPGVTSHVLSVPAEADIIDEVRGFTLKAIEAFNTQIPQSSEMVLLGCEWSAIPALQIISALRACPIVLCIQTLERQRSDMSSDASKQIEGFEIQGIHQARSVLIRGAATLEMARKLAASATGIDAKLCLLYEPFPADQFQASIDPGAIKARYQIGPVNPTLLFVGPLDEDHGADLVIKAVPLILKTHKKAHFIFVGDGPLFWMLRIHTRYLNLEHAVRIAGHVEGEALRELVQAADIIVAPARKTVIPWPIQAGWAAGKAVVASHEAAQKLITHEENGVLIYPLPDSCAWGVSRILEDSVLWGKVIENGKAKIAAEFGEAALALQLEKALSSN